MSIKTLSVPCPTCKKEVLMNDTFPDRPFCSKRCKSIDFGDWAAENHRVPGEELDNLEQELWSRDLDDGY